MNIGNSGVSFGGFVRLDADGGVKGRYACELFGASPAESAATNTAAIQAALDAAEDGGLVSLQSPGTYLVTYSAATTTACGKKTALAIHAGTRLTLGPEVTIKLADDSDCYMLVDYEGQEADSPNIFIEGGAWDQNVSNQTQRVGSARTTGADGTTLIHPTDAWMAHSLWFSRADRIVIRDARFLNAGKFAMLLSDCDDLVVDTITFDTESDGVHLHPPCSRFAVRNLRGTTNDNMVGVTAGDYENYETSLGDFADGVIENLAVLDCSEPVRLTGKAGYTFSDILIRNVSGSVNSGQGVNFLDDGVLTGAVMTRIRVEGIDLSMGADSGKIAVSVAASGLTDLAIRDITVRGADNLAVKCTVSPDLLSVDDLKNHDASDADMVQVTGVPALLRLTRASAKFPTPAGSGSVLRFTGAGGAGSVLMDTMYHEGGVLLATSSTTPELSVQAGNVVSKSANGGAFSVSSTVDLQVAGYHGIDSDYVAVCSDSAALRLSGRGYRRTGSGTGLAYINAGTFSVDWPDLRFSIPTTSGATTPTPVAGDRVYNTNTAQVAGVGPVVWTGSRWVAANNDPPVRRPLYRHLYEVLAQSGNGTWTVRGEYTAVTGTLAVIAAGTTWPTLNGYTSSTSGSEARVAGGYTNYKTNQGRGWVFRFIAKASDLTNARYYFGVTNQTSTTMSAADDPAGDYAGFQFSSVRPDTNLMCVTKDGTTQRATDSGLAADTNPHLFEIVATPTSVQFWIDGVLRATHAAELPRSAQAMRFAMTVTPTADEAKQVSLAWFTAEPIE
jgi:hypothetical protein